MRPTRRTRLHAVFSGVVVVVVFGLLNQVGLLNSSFQTAVETSLELPAAVKSRCTGTAPPSAVGVSIVAVSCNRTASLLRVLPTWLALRGVAEVLLLDWASEPAVHASLPTPLDPRVRLVRAPFETEWNLARAYNLAISLASRDVVLKLDSDTSVQPELLERQPLGAGEFWRGCSHRTSDENARHLNGVVLARRAHLLAVAGCTKERDSTTCRRRAAGLRRCGAAALRHACRCRTLRTRRPTPVPPCPTGVPLPAQLPATSDDERMQLYGYDDTDLYFRLYEALNLTERCIDFAHLTHAQEHHAARGLTRIHHILHKRAVSPRSGYTPVSRLLHACYMPVAHLLHPAQARR